MYVSTVDIAGERMAMTDEQVNPTAEPATRFRYAFAFRVEGDLKFISHQDTLRMFKRALSRTGLPVAYSEGFNPQPRLSIPLPRPVGVASVCEQLVVTMTQEIDLDRTIAQFQAQAPIGLTVTGCVFLPQGRRLMPCGVTYVLPMIEGDPTDLEETIDKILAADELIVSRIKHKTSKIVTVNIRPFIENVDIENHSLAIRLHVTDRGTAKPSEIAGLLGYDANTINHRIQRINIAWLEQAPFMCSDRKNYSSGDVDDSAPHLD